MRSPALPRAAAIALGLTLLGACRSVPSETPSAGTDTSSGGPSHREQPPVAPDTCGPQETELRDLGWLPRDVRFVALLGRGELDAAAGALSAHLTATPPSPPLPILARLELDQLGLQAQLVWMTLEQGGFSPAEMARIVGPEGLSAWVFLAPCDANASAARAGVAWKVLFRAAVDARIGKPFPDSPFPYDVLMLDGDRVALVPRDGAEAHRKWLAAPRPGGAGRQPPSPGELLEALEPAPIRVLVRGKALLEPGDGAAPAYGRTIRVTAGDVELSTLEPPAADELGGLETLNE